MAISNTNILIKRSLTTGKPASLNQAELAYSYASNTLFIGSPAGSGTVNVGGQFYTSTVDAATNANTVSTLVKRDVNGAFYGRLFGVSNTAVALDTAQNFSITGDVLASAVSFNGTGAVALASALNNINPNSGTFGTGTQVPVITVGANGRITSVTTTPITVSGTGSSFLTISDGTTSNTMNIAQTTFYHKGLGGLTATVSGNTITYNTDNTVLRSNTTLVGPQVINTDLTITGNLTIQGNATTVNTQTLNIVDPIIYLAANNYYGDTVSIGFAANYFDGSNQRHTGIVRDASTKQYYLFDNYLPELSSNNIIDRSNSSFRIATLTANVSGGRIFGLANTIGIQDGGTNNSTFTNNQLTFFNGTGIVSLANTGTAGTYANANTIPVITTDGFGRVSSITNTAIAITAAQVTSGQLAVAQGGTNNSTFTNNQVTYFNGTSIVSLANSTFSNTGTSGASATITSLQVDGFGRVNTAIYTPIAIAASQVTSGQLAIAQGGTNNSTFTQNQITYYNGTSIVSLANTGTAGTYANSNTIPVITTDGLGRVSSITNTAIAITAAQVTSGQLAVAQGGTNNSTFTNNQLTFFNGTSIVSLANTGTAGTYANSNTIPVITTDGFGRVSSVTNTAIAITAAQVTSGQLAVAQGGTNNNTFTNNQLTFFNGTSIVSLANTGTAGTYANSNTIPVITTDGFGRVSSVTNTAIAITAAQVTSGQLAIAQGGTNNNTYTPNQITFYNGTSIVSLANSTFSNTGTYGSNSTITALQVDGFGRVNTAVYTAIAGLTVGQGGTGASTFTTSGVLYGNGTGALQATALAGSGDQTFSNQILTVNATGVPVWSTAMDGGQF